MSDLKLVSELNDQQEYSQRLLKVKALVDAGQNPYVFKFDRTHDNPAFLKAFEDVSDSCDTSVSVAGRLISKRGHGKAFFGHLLDEHVSLQIYSNLDLLGQEGLASLQQLDVGDWVGVQGTPFRTKRGELSVRVSSFTLLSKALLPLPEKYHGLQDKELRYRSRYLDLVANLDVRETFKKRSKIISFVRRFLEDRAFMEVETPVLQSVYGGASARPFVTHHNELKQDLYLRIALELYLKRLIVGGYERVFEIGRVFRNEGISYKHNPEFTMLELYQAYVDYEAMMTLTEELFRALVEECCGGLILSYQGKKLDFSRPFQRLRMVDAIVKYVQVDVEDEDSLRAKAVSAGIELPNSASKGQIITELYDTLVEPQLIEPTFIYDYPWETSPLAKRRQDNPDFVERFECIICGMELANAFSELTDPIDQEFRFKDQLKAKEAGWEDVHEMDEDYIQALKHGMPPTGGLGIGIDRLVMLLCDAASIRDVLLFPHMRPKK